MDNEYNFIGLHSTWRGTNRACYAEYWKLWYLGCHDAALPQTFLHCGEYERRGLTWRDNTPQRDPTCTRTRRNEFCRECCSCKDCAYHLCAKHLGCCCEVDKCSLHRIFQQDKEAKLIRDEEAEDKDKQLIVRVEDHKRWFSHYDALNVRKSASDEQISAAYKERARLYHPDRSGSHDAFVKINEAYNCLRDRSSRKKYDKAQARDRKRAKNALKEAEAEDEDCRRELARTQVEQATMKVRRELEAEMARKEARAQRERQEAEAKARREMNAKMQAFEQQMETKMQALLQQGKRASNEKTSEQPPCKRPRMPVDDVTDMETDKDEEGGTVCRAVSWDTE